MDFFLYVMLPAELVSASIFRSVRCFLQFDYIKQYQLTHFVQIYMKLH